MTYKETIKWLFSQLPMFQRQGATAYKKDLSNIIELCAVNCNPHNKFKTIHIGGTNGKGSVSHILASILQAAGYKTGLYTSPHLKDFRERIKINGEMISENNVINFVNDFMSYFEKIKPSFFEMSVAMAFDHFAKNKVDIAIIEVGLGGRLDSTNIVSPILSIITNISLDHTQFLGNTMESIAFEKAGIIKTNIPVVIGETCKETKQVFREKARENGSDIYFADKKYKVTNSSITKNSELKVSIIGETKSYNDLISEISGKYQLKNIITAIQSIEILSNIFKIKREDIYTGMKNIRTYTGFKGRWEILGNKPMIVADTGHNIAGLTEIFEQIKTINYSKLHIVFGVVNDKKIDQILKLLPANAKYYFTKADIPRSMNEEKLQKKAKKFTLEGNSFSTVKRALNSAKNNANESDLILICGSTFIVAEII